MEYDSFEKKIGLRTVVLQLLPSELTKPVESRRTDVGNVFVERQVWRHCHAKDTDLGPDLQNKILGKILSLS